MAYKICSGDEVVVLNGSSKGEKGMVLLRTEDHVYIQGVNLKKRSIKSQGEGSPHFKEIEGAVHVSNVKILVKDTPVKLKVAFDVEGKYFYYMENGSKVIYRYVKDHPKKTEKSS